MNSSMITSAESPLPPVEAYSQQAEMSSVFLMVDCPFPEEDINGLITHGKPIS